VIESVMFEDALSLWKSWGEELDASLIGGQGGARVVYR